MSDEFVRYAVYWVPRWPDPLAAFGVSWTGWCAERGEVRSRGAFPGFAGDSGEMIRDLWRHGLHGIVQAPFALAPGRSQFSLEHALGELAEELVAFQLPRLEPAVLGRRVGLTPVRSPGALATLMRRVADGLAPLAARDDDRKGNGFAEASPGEVESHGSLVPFPGRYRDRFHVPLTDPMPIERAHGVRDALFPVVASMLSVPRSVDELALMGDPGGGRPLRVLQRYELLDWPLRRGSHALPCHGPRVLSPMPSRRRHEAHATV